MNCEITCQIKFTHRIDLGWEKKDTVESIRNALNWILDQDRSELIEAKLVAIDNKKYNVLFQPEDLLK